MMRFLSTVERHAIGCRCGFAQLLGGLFALLTLTGCSEIESIATFEPITDPAELFVWLRLDQRAVNMSTVTPYDTLSLVATPLNGLGARMEDVSGVTFRSSDPTRVGVTTTGQLHARAPASGVKIIAELVTEGNIGHADTAYVNVVADPEPPELATFSITPMSPEKRVWYRRSATGVLGELILRAAGINVRATIPLRALDIDGNPIRGLQIEYWSLDTDVVQVHHRSGNVIGPRGVLGAARIVARTTAYGVVKSDTATYMVTFPIVQGILFRESSDGGLSIGPTEVTVGAGGYVFWTNLTDAPIDIKFRDSTAAKDIPEVCAVFGDPMCGGGNIPAFARVSENAVLSSRGRQFLKPGVYRYRSAAIGQAGRVRVVASDDPMGN